MSKRWKVFLIALILLMSYSIFQISQTKLQIDLVEDLLSPYTVYGEPSRTISLIGADDVESVKEMLMEISDSSRVSFTLAMSNPADEYKGYYYWYLQDSKYLARKTGLNKDLDVESFNKLEEPITNNPRDQYHFHLPLSSYSYEIRPFASYKQSNLSNIITIFAESDRELNEFIRGLRIKGLGHRVWDLDRGTETSILRDMALTILQNPLVFLTFSLFLLGIFGFLYGDRKNLTIKLVNGYSKFQYIVENIGELVKLQLISFIGGFLIYYPAFLKLNVRHLSGIFAYYISLVFLVNLLSIVLLTITVYSFTDINYASYIRGLGSKSHTEIIISLAKLALSFLICLSLIQSSLEIASSISVYSYMKERADSYADMYIIDSSGNYGLSIMDKSDEIIEALEGFDNIIYSSAFGTGESGEVKHKVVYVNSNYLKRHPLLDHNQNPIDPDKANLVYSKENNVQGVEELKPFPGFLCESEDNCLDIETIILDEDAELILYSPNPFSNQQFLWEDNLSDDFVLVPKNKGFFILDLLFIFENDREMDMMRNELGDIVDIDKLVFRKLTDDWQENIYFHRDRIISHGLDLISYIFITMLLSLIYYQLKFDKVSREFSIYWVNGVNKFNYFYRGYFKQLMANTLMIVLVRKFLYPELSVIVVGILIIIYMAIDGLSLLLFRRQFHRQLQKNIRG